MKFMHATKNANSKHCIIKNSSNSSGCSKHDCAAIWASTCYSWMVLIEPSSYACIGWCSLLHHSLTLLCQCICPALIGALDHNRHRHFDDYSFYDYCYYRVAVLLRLAHTHLFVRVGYINLNRVLRLADQCVWTSGQFVYKIYNICCSILFPYSLAWCLWFVFAISLDLSVLHTHSSALSGRRII